MLPRRLHGECARRGYRLADQQDIQATDEEKARVKEMQEAVGKPGNPSSSEVTSTDIRLFARAVGDHEARADPVRLKDQRLLGRGAKDAFKLIDVGDELASREEAALYCPPRVAGGRNRFFVRGGIVQGSIDGRWETTRQCMNGRIPL